MNILPKILLVWTVLFLLAFVNGALREVFIRKILGIKSLVAHQLSCLTGTILWTGAVLILWNFLGITTINEAVAAGVFWFVLTIVTETFLINKLMSKLTWKQILATYDLRKGELWGLVLVWIGLIPVIVYAIKR